MIRILLADDQDLLCEILQTSLESQPDLQIVGRACNGEMALEKVDILRPDIALIDINMPVMNGLVATEKITRDFPETKVIILSGSEGEYFRQDAINAGAKSYIPKTVKANDIINQIRSVYQQDRIISPEELPTEMIQEISQVRQEVKDYVQRVEQKLDKVEQTEATIKTYFDKLAHENGNLSTQNSNFKSTVEPIVTDIKQLSKESKQHKVEINRIQTLIEGQLSYVHNLNKQAKKNQQYLLTTCALAALALILSLVSLIF
ncbi:MAG: response regulator [Cyanobacteria bacterium P01_G01_bin.39]